MNKTKKKLSLTKVTVANLAHGNLSKIQAGAPPCVTSEPAVTYGCTNLTACGQATCQATCTCACPTGTCETYCTCPPY